MTLFVWFRDNKPYRVSDDPKPWRGSTFIDGDRVERVYLLEDIVTAFLAGQKSIGWRDDSTTRIDMTVERYVREIK